MDDIKRIDLVDIELTGGSLHRSWCKHTIGTADELANAFGVRVFRDGEAVNLGGGSVQGFFRDPQGNNIPLATTGTIDYNVAYVVLTAECYNYEGQFCLAIKVKDTDNDITSTMRIVDGIVDNTHTDNPVVPTDSVPDYTDILAVYEEMLEAKAGSVRFDITQSLTTAQKTKARTNIDAAGIAQVVRVDDDQSLTNTQKTKARSNIGAASTDTATTSANGLMSSTDKIKLNGVETEATKTIIDTTLANSGQAADAKQTGDKIIELKNVLTNYNNFNVIDYLTNPSTVSWRGIDFTNNGNGTYTVDGTATDGDFYNNFFISTTELPYGTHAGQFFRIAYDAEDVELQVYSYNGSTYTLLCGTKSDTTVKIPNDAVGLTIRFFVAEGQTVDNETISEPSIVVEPINSIHTAKNANLSLSSVHADNIGSNEILYKYDTQGNTDELPYPTWMGNMFSAYGGDGLSDHSGMGVLALSHDRRIHFRDKWGQNPTWSLWKELVTDPADCFTGTFPATATDVDTRIQLLANTAYIVHFNSEITGGINIFGGGNTSNVARVSSNKQETLFKNDGTKRTLHLYNYDGADDDIDITVTPLRNDLNQIKRYYISKTDAMADYTSVTQCLLDLKNDYSEKEIYIDGGDYDLFQEYADAEVPVYTGDNPTFDYFNYCVWVPTNTHIIGRGIVKLIWMPDAEDVTYNQAMTVSPLNVAGSCVIENVEVHCKNGRYCLHNDALGKSGYNGAIQVFKDVKFYMYPSDTKDGHYLSFTQTTGFGIDREMHHIYENCEFHNTVGGRAFYGHTRGTVGGVTLTKPMSSNITLTNCIFDTTGDNAVVLGNSDNSNIRIRVKFSSCYFNKRIYIKDESGDTGSYQNQYDLTLLNCNNPTIIILDSNNPYEPKIYPPVT